MLIGKSMLMRRAVHVAAVALFGPLLAAQQGRPGRIQHIDIVMLSHLDVGFTDQPYVVVNELKPRYLDVALDAALATASEPPERRFHWTEESLLPVVVWWRNASPERREELLRAVQNGQIDAGAMPFNTLPFENADEWKRVTDWVPPELWKALAPHGRHSGRRERRVARRRDRSCRSRDSPLIHGHERI